MNKIKDILNSISSEEKAEIENNMLLAAKIYKAMKARGWSKLQFMKAVNKKNPSIITKWFSGTHNFTVNTLYEIERVLNIELVNKTNPDNQLEANYIFDLPDQIINTETSWQNGLDYIYDSNLINYSQRVEAQC
jgi:transcriptional regulator with XRE-family HTH domain